MASNEAVSSDTCSSEDILFEFGGVARRSDRMEGSDRDHLYFFFKKYKHRSVIELCITLVKCNQVCI